MQRRYLDEEGREVHEIITPWFDKDGKTAVLLCCQVTWVTPDTLVWCKWPQEAHGTGRITDHKFQASRHEPDELYDPVRHA